MPLTAFHRALSPLRGRCPPRLPAENERALFGCDRYRLLERSAHSRACLLGLAQTVVFALSEFGGDLLKNVLVDACNEAVSVLLPLGEKLPNAFGWWMRTMTCNRLRCNRACGRRPDEGTSQRLSPFLASEDKQKV